MSDILYMVTYSNLINVLKVYYDLQVAIQLLLQDHYLKMKQSGPVSCYNRLKCVTG
jgi:hypothetical protein